MAATFLRELASQDRREETEQALQLDIEVVHHVSRVVVAGKGPGPSREPRPRLRTEAKPPRRVPFGDLHGALLFSEGHFPPVAEYGPNANRAGCLLHQFAELGLPAGHGFKVGEEVPNGLHRPTDYALQFECDHFGLPSPGRRVAGTRASWGAMSPCCAQASRSVTAVRNASGVARLAPRRWTGTQAAEGMAPICWRRPKMSSSAHCATTRPPFTLNMLIPRNSIDRPVAGTPARSPEWTPRQVMRLTTRSPCAI